MKNLKRFNPRAQSKYVVFPRVVIWSGAVRVEFRLLPIKQLSPRFPVFNVEIQRAMGTKKVVTGENNCACLENINSFTYLNLSCKFLLCLQDSFSWRSDSSLFWLALSVWLCFCSLPWQLNNLTSELEMAWHMYILDSLFSVLRLRNPQSPFVLFYFIFYTLHLNLNQSVQWKVCCPVTYTESVMEL